MVLACPFLSGIDPSVLRNETAIHMVYWSGVCVSEVNWEPHSAWMQVSNRTTLGSLETDLKSPAWNLVPFVSWKQRRIPK